MFVFALTATISMAQREYKMVVPFEVKLGVNPEVDFQILEGHNYSLQTSLEKNGYVTYVYEASHGNHLIMPIVENNKVISVLFVYHPYDADWNKAERMYNSISTYITKRLKYTLGEDKGFTYYGKKVRAHLRYDGNDPRWNYEPYISFQVILKEQSAWSEHSFLFRLVDNHL